MTQQLSSIANVSPRPWETKTFDTDAAWNAFQAALLASAKEGVMADLEPAFRATVNDVLVGVQRTVEYFGVQAARDNSWCGVFKDVMSKMFVTPLDGVEWRDREGQDCSGHTWRDDDGFDREGRDHDGRDKDGFDRNGRDRQGYDRDGMDEDGCTVDDPSRFRYNANGIDIDGFYRDGRSAGLGRDSMAKHRADTEQFKYDRFMCDASGFDASGYDRGGFDRYGYNRRGYDANGFDRRGWARNASRSNPGKNVYTGTDVDVRGFDMQGYVPGSDNDRSPVDGYGVNGYGLSDRYEPAYDYSSSAYLFSPGRLAVEAAEKAATAE